MWRGASRTVWRGRVARCCDAQFPIRGLHRAPYVGLAGALGAASSLALALAYGSLSAPAAAVMLLFYNLSIARSARTTNTGYDPAAAIGQQTGPHQHRSTDRAMRRQILDVTARFKFSLLVCLIPDKQDFNCTPA